MTVEVVTAACLAAAIWSLLCRVSMMEIGVTRPAVILGATVLLLALFAALIMPATIAKASLAAGVLGYLLAGAGRWREGPPPETQHQNTPPASAPIPAPPEAMRHVAGGSKDSG